MSLQWYVEPMQAYSGDLWGEWHQIASQWHKENPMLDARFVETICDFFADNIFIAKGIADQQLKVLMLLERSSKNVWTAFKPSQCQVALIVSQKVEDFFLERLMKAIPGWCIKLDLFALDPLEHSNLIKNISKQDQSNYCLNIDIDCTLSFDDYWQARPKKLRQNISRYEKRVSRELETPVFKVVTEPGDVVRATDKYGMLESQGWKGKNKTALHPGNSQGQFYRRLMEKFAVSENAIVFELFIAGKLVASRLTIFTDDKLIALKTTYDESYRKHAIGRLLLFRVIEYLMNNKIAATLDFYTNATPEQQDWATNSRHQYNASIFRFSFLSSLSLWAKKIKSVKKHFGQVRGSKDKQASQKVTKKD